MKKKSPTDEEDLIGDFVGETGQPQLLFNQALGVHGGDEDDYVPLDRSEPCFRSSLLLLRSLWQQEEDQWKEKRHQD